MLPHKYQKCPSLMTKNQRPLYDHTSQNCTEAVQVSRREKATVNSENKDHRIKADIIRKDMHWPGSNHLYAGPVRKPRFLEQLENYVKRELQAIDSSEPKLQELRLQVYRQVFSRFISEFRTYQPLLDAIKKEYENSLVYLQDQIRELEPLRPHLRLVTVECDRKILEHWEEEQEKTKALKTEMEQLQKKNKILREKEASLQTVVSHLQAEVFSLYQKYREEHDACNMAIRRFELSQELTRCSNTTDDKTAEEGDMDPVKLALSVCREDLTRVQEELTRVQAGYSNVVPKSSWEALESTHKQTLQQMERLQGDFDQLKAEHDTLLELQTMYPATDQGKGDKKSTVTRQANQKQYISHLREQLGDKGKVSVEDIRAALICIDPGINSNTLDCKLSLAFQVNKENLEECTTLLDTEAVLQRILSQP